MNNTKFLEGIAHELKFWKGFVQTPRFLDGWVSFNKTPELNMMAYDFITGMTKPTSKVLDVGSGVVSILNGTISPSKLTAADPLGGLYECIFDYEKYGIKPPIPVTAEDMNIHSEYDIVHMSNAIDHAQNPERVIYNLWEACKPGGFIIIQGFENEGTFENWEGFHQWDIVVRNNAIVITDRDGKSRYVKQDKTVLLEYFTIGTKTWYLWIFQK